MPKKKNKKYIANYKIYNKLESLEKKIDNEKSKSNSNFEVTFLMSSGMALFIIGLTFLIPLLVKLGSSQWVISIGYIIIGIICLKIGIIMHSRINEK